MRFPTTDQLLPNPELTPADRERLRLKARGLVDDAIAQYETFVRVHHRRLSRQQWKVVKRREGLTVYKERKHARARGDGDVAGAGGNGEGDDVLLAGEDALHTPSTVRSTMPSLMLQQLQRETSLAARDTSMPATPQPHIVGGAGGGDEPQREWKLPALLMVGSIVGTLEDVMYGVATFDAASMLLKTTYTHDELVDGEILSQIRGPTPEDPFQFLGLKWIVKGNPAAVSKLIHPRDLVFLEATGVETRWNGERYGYHLMHSEDVEGCGPLRRKLGVLRAKLETCVIYRQLPNGTVDVYMKANLDSNGSVGESVALFSAANGLSYCWRAVVCAQNKKLAWLLAQNQEKIRSEAELAAAMTGSIFVAPMPSSRRVKGKGVCCIVCRKSANPFRHMVSCELCNEPMCSRCRVSKKLSHTTWRHKEVVTREVLLCKRCVTRSTGSDSLEIAREEVMSGKWEMESDISIMPMPSRTSSSASSNYYYCQEDGAERKPPRVSASETGFDRTLKLSLARLELKENEESDDPVLEGSHSASSSFPIHGHLWGNSFDSTPGAGADDDEVDEEDQEYYFDEQGRASEVPRPSYASSVSRTSSFVDISSLVGDHTRVPSFTEPPAGVVPEALTSSSVPTTPITLYVEPTATAAERTLSSASAAAADKHRSRSVSSPPEFSRGPLRSLSDASASVSQTRPSAPDLSGAPAPSPAHQRDPQDLFQQMMMLRDAAEHVYLYTRHNSDVHAGHTPQAWPSVR